jgi:hypothetical protein
MRNFTLTLFVLVFTISAWAQSNVPRNLVVVEIATGTWCVYCPGSALAADELYANNDPVAIIEHHNGDAFATPESEARITWYNVSGFPTAYFDGENESVGGDASNSIYPSYIPKVNQAIAVNTPLGLSVDLVNPVGNDYEVTATIDQVASVPNGNYVLEVVVTESHLPVNWFGLSEVNEVNRMMIPDENGTAITLPGVGNQEVMNVNFTLPSSYVKGNCELIVFIQDLNTKTIFNGTRNIVDLASIPVDMEIIDFAVPVKRTYCEDEISPVVSFTNVVGPAVTSVDIEYSVNGGTPMVYNWTGYMEVGDTTDVSLPAISFDPVSSGNYLNVDVVNPNGLQDPNSTNNGLNATWDKPSHAAGTYTVEMKLDNYGSEITWEAYDAAGTKIGSGGPYPDNSVATITETFEVVFSGSENSNNCYSFAIYDSWGDGLTWLQSPGYYKLMDPTGKVVEQSTDGDFGQGDEINFEASWATDIEPQLDKSAVQVYPNPNSGMFTVRLTEMPREEVELEVYQLNGQLMQEVSTKQMEYAFDISDYPAGIYLLKVRTQDGVLTEKITKY